MEKEKAGKALPEVELLLAAKPQRRFHQLSPSQPHVPLSLPWGCSPICWDIPLTSPPDQPPGQHFWRRTWQIFQALTYPNRVILEPQLSSHILFSSVTKTRHLVFLPPPLSN